MTDPAIKTEQLPHQAEIYLAERDSLGYALFHEMGLGKTKLMIDVFCHLFLAGKIDGVLVLAPNAVYSNWLTEEMPRHCAAPYVKLLFSSGSKGDKARMRRALFLSPEEWRGRLRVMCMAYDGLRTDHGFKLAHDFSILYRLMIIADESTALKNPSTVTAKKAKKIRANCHYAWIATGTPTADKPFDIHSQIEFVFPDFWQRHGMRSISAFRAQFGVYEQRRAGMRIWSECVGYRDVDKLHDLVKSVSSRLLKEDSTVKLPPKMYKTISFELGAAQRRVYDQLREEFLAELDGGDGFVEASLAIVRLTRLQQIASGFVTAETPTKVAISLESQPEDDELGTALDAFDVDQHVVDDAITTWATAEIKPRITEKQITDLVSATDNPRLAVLLQIVEECTHKMIVWCRFRRDVDIVCDALGEQCVRYDGSTKLSSRVEALRRFKDPADSARIFVANIHTISQGVTLTIAKTMVYYTNSFSPEKRLQSEDRGHRIGQDSPLLIIDLVARDTVDEKLIEGLRRKYAMSARVMGDRYREWIQPIRRDDDEA